MSFAMPQAAYLLFAVPFILLGGVTLFFYRRRSLETIGSKEVQKAVVVPRALYWVKLGCLIFAWIFATFALMGPRGNPQYAMQAKEADGKRKIHDLVLLLDTSASMLVEDTSTRESRLEFSKQLLDRVVQNSKGDNVSLVAFTSETETLSPPTLDKLWVRMMLGNVSINNTGVTGTDVIGAIQDLQDVERPTTIVLVTDGGDHDQALDLPKGALRLITVGVGSEEGGIIPGIQSDDGPVTSALNRAFLSRLSERYIETKARSIMDVADEIQEAIDEDPSFFGESMIEDSKQSLLYDRYFQLPLAISLFLLGIVYFAPNTWVRVSCLLLMLSSLHAEEWQERRARRNQAVEWMQQGKLKEAEERLVPLSLLEVQDPALAEIAKEDLAVLWLHMARHAEKEEAVTLLRQAVNFARGELARQIDVELAELGASDEETLEVQIEDLSSNLPDDDPKNALKWLIERQSRILQATRIDPTDSRLLEWQNRLPLIARRFVPLAIESQEAESSRCHCEPWNDVFPLFATGLEAAEKAMEFFESENQSMLLLNQERAAHFWSRALDALDRPPQESQPEPIPQKLIQRVRQMEIEDQMDEEPKEVREGGSLW